MNRSHSSFATLAVAIASLLLVTTTASAQTITAIPGDVNASQSVDVTDVQTIINQALAIVPTTAEGDVNQDSSVNVLDVQATIGVALGMPSLIRAEPAMAPVGGTLVLVGANFSATLTDNVVLIDGMTATVTGTQTVGTTIVALEVTVPVGATNGNVSLSVGGQSAGATSFTPVTGPTMALVSGDNQDVMINSQSAPLTVRLLDASANPAVGETVTFAVTAGTAQLSATTAMTDSAGEASVTLTTASSPETVTITATNAAFNGSPVTFTLSTIVLPEMTMVSGDNQTGMVGQPAPEDCVVMLTDQNGQPAVGVTVTFQSITGGGTVSPQTATTDATGRAGTRLTFNPTTPGAHEVTATAPGFAGSPLIFFLVGMGQPTMVIAGGDGQQASICETLPLELQVTLIDSLGGTPQGETVTFAIATGEGTLSNTTATTNASGQASTMLTLGRNLGPVTVTATASSFTSTTQTFTAEAVVDPVLQGVGGFAQLVNVNAMAAEPLRVRVLDRFRQPDANATVNFALAGSGSLSATSVQSDSDGFASVTYTAGSTPDSATVTATATGFTGQASFELSVVPSGRAIFAGGPLGASDTMTVTLTERISGAPLPGVYAFIGMDGNLSTAQLQTSDELGQVRFTGITGPQTLTVFQPSSPSALISTYYDVDARFVNLLAENFGGGSGVNGTVTIPATQANNGIFASTTDAFFFTQFFPPQGQNVSFGFFVPTNTPYAALFYEAMDPLNDDYRAVRGDSTGIMPALPAGSMGPNLSLSLPQTPNASTVTSTINLAAPFTTAAESGSEEAFLQVPNVPGELSCGGGDLSQTASTARPVTISFIRGPAGSTLSAEFSAFEQGSNGEIFCDVQRFAPQTATSIPAVTTLPPLTLTSPMASSTITRSQTFSFTVPAGAHLVAGTVGQFGNGPSGFFFKEWDVFMPPTRSSFALPLLPNEFTDVAPAYDGSLLEVDIFAVTLDGPSAPSSVPYNGFDFTDLFTDQAVDRTASGSFVEVMGTGDSFSLIPTGNTISVQPGNGVSQTFTASVIGSGGAPQTGVPITLTVTTGNATVASGSTMTDGQGLASVSLNITGPGPATVEMRAQGVAQPLSFTVLRGDPIFTGSPTSDQVVQPGDTIQPLSVTVTDNQGAPVAGVMVAFKLLFGSTSLTLDSSVPIGADPQSNQPIYYVTTDANGVASINGRSGFGEGTFTVEASLPGFNANTQFEISTTSDTVAPQMLATGGGPLQNSELVVRVVRQFTLAPIFGATVFVSDPMTGALIAEMVTGNNGRAVLSNITGPVTVTAASGNPSQPGGPINSMSAITLAGVNASRIDIALFAPVSAPVNGSINTTGQGSVTANLNGGDFAPYPSFNFFLPLNRPFTIVGFDTPNSAMGDMRPDRGFVSSQAGTPNSGLNLFFNLPATSNAVSLTNGAITAPSSMIATQSFNTAIEGVYAMVAGQLGVVRVGGGSPHMGPQQNPFSPGAGLIEVPSASNYLVNNQCQVFPNQPGQTFNLFSRAITSLAPGASQLPTVTLPEPVAVLAPTPDTTGFGANTPIQFTTNGEEDFVVVMVNQNRQASNSNTNWTVIAPPGTGSVSFPQLPSALSGAGFQSGVVTNYNIRAVDLPGCVEFDNHDDVFQAAFSNFVPRVEMRDAMAVYDATP